MNGLVELADGLRLRLRPVRREDKALLREAFARLSSHSRYMRFFAPLHDLSEPMLTALTLADADHFASVALACEGDHEAPAGVARYVRLKNDPSSAELALTVVDAYQGRGIGHLLLDALVLEAADAGLTRFEGEILGENYAIRAVLGAAGAELHLNDHGSVGFTLDLTTRAAELRQRGRNVKVSAMQAGLAAPMTCTT